MNKKTRRGKNDRISNQVVSLDDFRFERKFKKNGNIFQSIFQMINSVWNKLVRILDDEHIAESFRISTDFFRVAVIWLDLVRSLVLFAGENSKEDQAVSVAQTKVNFIKTFKQDFRM